jgi:hypothetical protein
MLKLNQVHNLCNNCECEIPSKNLISLKIHSSICINPDCKTLRCSRCYQEYFININNKKIYGHDPDCKNN